MDSASISASYTFARSLFGGITLLTYDSILSFGDEMEYIWLPKFTLPTLLYCWARYATLISLIIGLTPLFTNELAPCNSLTYVGYIFEIMGYIGIQGLLIARAYALATSYAPAKSKRIVFVFGTLAVVFLGAVGFSIAPIFLVPGCVLQAGLVIRCVSLRPSINMIIDIDYTNLTLAQNILTMATETIVLTVTLHGVIRSRNMKISNLMSEKKNSPIQYLLLEQGVLRYLFVAIASIINVVLVATNNSSPAADFWNTIQGSLSAITVCQFLVTLRKRYMGNNISIISPSKISALEFAHNSTVTDLGQPAEQLGCRDESSAHETV